MATTYQNILKGIRNANLLERSQVNAGWTDGLAPPYISVIEYEHSLQYDTGGLSLKEATFKVVVVHRNCDEAETLAEAADAAVSLDDGLTPQAIGVFQESYRSSQTDERLQQWAVEIGYKLIEDPSK
jgi:hypothetical protein